MVRPTANPDTRRLCCSKPSASDSGGIGTAEIVISSSVIEMSPSRLRAKHVEGLAADVVNCIHNGDYLVREATTRPAGFDQPTRRRTQRSYCLKTQFGQRVQGDSFHTVVLQLMPNPALGNLKTGIGVVNQLVYLVEDLLIRSYCLPHFVYVRVDCVAMLTREVIVRTCISCRVFWRHGDCDADHYGSPSARHPHCCPRSW